MNQERPRASHESALARHDREAASAHASSRRAPDHDAAWPKDDRRSSSRLEPRRAGTTDHLTFEERSATWPLG